MTALLQQSSETRWTHPAFGRLADLALQRAGLVFPENRRDSTEAAMRRAMAHAGIPDATAFADRVRFDDDTYETLVGELTIGETYFFRDPAQWQLIRDLVAPDLLRDGPGNIRAWSAGCASGEEAYTLALVLREAGCANPRVTGSDICEHRLARASRAVYTRWSMRGADQLQRSRYFRETSQHFHLLPEYRDVQFRRVNLASREYGEPGQELFGLDLILCRNVLIYLDHDVINAVFARLVSSLRIGGWLMIAASDPQPAEDLPLEVVLTDAGLLFKRVDVKSRRAPAAVPSEYPPVHPAAATQFRDEYFPVARQLPNRIEYSAPANTPTTQPKVKTIAAFLVEAQTLADRGDVAAAWSITDQASTEYPESARIQLLLATLEAERGNFAASADAARRAIYLDRTLAMAHLTLGTVLLRSGNAAAADRPLRAAERALVALDGNEIVPQSGGATAQRLLDVVQAHRSLMQRVTNAR